MYADLCHSLFSYPGVGRDSRHKRRETGGKRKSIRKKRKFELARPAAMTKLAAKDVRHVRTMGGNSKWRALAMDAGNFSWGSEGTLLVITTRGHIFIILLYSVCTRKTRILDVVYNCTNNELLRTKTLVKNCIVEIDATPFRQWYEQHYGIRIGVKKGTDPQPVDLASKSQACKDKLTKRQGTRTLDTLLDEQFVRGRVYAAISSRPGQSGRADGYILEGKELDFYKRKIETKKSKK